MVWRLLILILIPVFTSSAYAAKKTMKADVEKFVQDYVVKVAKKDLTGKIATADAFQAAIEDDSEDFEDCAKGSCKVVLREPVKTKEYDEDDEDAPEEDMFEVHMDVYKSGDLLARRSGCYMVMKNKDGKLVMQDYQYDCTE